MAFKGYFTNGAKKDFSTMEFGLSNFKATPDAGIFSGNLKVVNFLEPDIKLQLNSKFNLEFIAKFLNMKDLEDMKGDIELEMNFHDIIDLRHPEKSIEKLNESYFTKLKVTDLSFRSANYHLPLDNLNIEAEMEGHEVKISRFDAKIGKSDISIKGTISDLPAILHHTDDKIKTDLIIESNLLDLAELSYNDSLKKPAIDEQSARGHKPVMNSALTTSDRQATALGWCRGSTFGFGPRDAGSTPALRTTRTRP